MWQGHPFPLLSLSNLCPPLTLLSTHLEGLESVAYVRNEEDPAIWEVVRGCPQPEAARLVPGPPH